MQFLSSGISNRYVSASMAMSCKSHFYGLYKAGLVTLYDLGYSREVNVLHPESLLGSIADFGRRVRIGYGKVELSEWYVALELFYIRKEIASRGISEELQENLDFLELLHSTLVNLRKANEIDVYWFKAKLNTLGTKKKEMSWRFEDIGSVIKQKGVRYAVPTGMYLGMLKDSEDLVTVGYDTASSAFVRERCPELYDDLLKPYWSDIMGSSAWLEGVFSLDNFDGYGAKRLEWFNKSVSSWGELEFTRFNPEFSFKSLGSDYRFLGADGVSLYFTKPLDVNSVRQFAYSAFLIDYETGKVLPPSNSFTGLTGDMVELDGTVTASGCPVRLVSPEGVVKFYVDSEQCFPVAKESLIVDLGLRLDLAERGSHELLSEDSNSYYVDDNGNNLPVRLVHFFRNSHYLAEEGVYIRELVSDASWSIVSLSRSFAYSEFISKCK